MSMCLVIWLKSKEGILKFVKLYLSIKSFFKNIYIYMNLAFWLDVFPLDGETLFSFIYEKLIYCLENDLESPLIFVLFFLKG